MYAFIHSDSVCACRALPFIFILHHLLFYFISFLCSKITRRRELIVFANSHGLQELRFEL